jgi:hypothetical protein
VGCRLTQGLGLASHRTGGRAGKVSVKLISLLSVTGIRDSESPWCVLVSCCPQKVLVSVRKELRQPGAGGSRLES